MKTYNRALDYTALALNELRKGKTELAARLLVKASEQSDAVSAIAILEASNKQAYKAQISASAKARLQAAEEGIEFEEPSEEVADAIDCDPLDEVEDETEVEAEMEPEEEEIEEEDVATQMAKVMSTMKRRSK